MKKASSLRFIILLLSFYVYCHASFASSLKAGLHVEEISPTVNKDRLPTIGHMDDRLPVTKIHDPLYLKAFAVSNGETDIIFISLDLIVLAQEESDYLNQMLREELGFEHSVVSVTHTHSGFFTEEMQKQLRPKILESAKKALQNLQAVSVAATSTEVSESYNRRVIKANKVEMLWTNHDRIKTRETDSEVGIVHFKTNDDKALMTFINYSAHPVVTMNLEKVVISGDYPNHAAEHITSELGGEVIFHLGAGGDVNPYDAATSPIEKSLQASRVLGELIASRVIASIKKIETYTTESELSFDVHTFDDPKAEVGVIKLTPEISLAHFPGEYFDADGIKYKRASPFKTDIFIGMTNGDLFYVPPPHEVELGGYGAEMKSLRVKKDTSVEHIEYAIMAAKELFNEKEPATKQ